ncbi:MAG: substrate-binding domain-containing protein [Nitrospirota bacterium]
MGEKHKAEPASNIENRLQTIRMARGLSQTELARSAGITRQAVCAIEANRYLPTTAVALRLAGALGCRVEDLFSLLTIGEHIEGDLVGSIPLHASHAGQARVKVARIGTRFVIRPVSALGEILNFTVPADGLLIGPAGGERRTVKPGSRVTVRLLRDRRGVEQEVAVAGCDPAIVLAGEYLRRHHHAATVVGWTMGSAAALEALKRGEVHMAGLHIVDAKSGESNLPYLRRHLTGEDVMVVTFAIWEEGLLVRSGNPKGIRNIGDLAREDVTLMNREGGAGARLLLDQKLAATGIDPAQVNGYRHVARSHFEVARTVAEGRADVGIGIRAAARYYGLDFIPLQEARYDLVVPKAVIASHPTLSVLLDTIVSRPFRTEVEALGGYDTRETGTVRSLRGSRVVHAKSRKEEG